MQRRSFRFWLSLGLCGVIGLQTGCAGLMTEAQTIKRQTLQALKPRAGDRRDDIDEPEEEWVSDAGRQARGDRPYEVDRDPLHKYLSSPKAREIERNLGVIGVDD